MGDNPTPDSNGSSGNGGLSRRRLLGVSGAAGLTAVGASALAGCGVTGASQSMTAFGNKSSESGIKAPPAEGVLGANFNGDPRSMNFDELRDLKATWLRGFVPMETIKEDPAKHPNIRTLLDAGSQGYKTVLSLKFPFNKYLLPTPGSPAMEAEIKRLDKVLPAVMNKVDILVIGNEPFIESKYEDQKDESLNVVYEKIAQHVIDFRDRHPGSKTQLYMGALNHLDWPSWQTPATERWMRFVHDTDALNGVDIHPHLPEPGNDQQYLDYILPRMRSDQKFLATEFSLVLFWKKQLKKPISPEFSGDKSNNVQPDTPVWKVLKQAIDDHFPQEKWDRLLAAIPSFSSHKNYIQNQMETFRQTDKLAVATYGVGQDAAMVEKFDAESTPWLLNSLFCPQTVQPGKDGLPGRNKTWIEGFRASQHG